MHEAYKVRAVLPATITVLHVQSHQDETTSDPNSLSLAAHLNIFADSRTHQVYKDCPHFHQTPLLPSTQAVLVLNGRKVTSKMTTLASLAYYKPIMQDYFLNKFGWDAPTFGNIDWDSSEREYQHLSPGCRLASFKLQNGLWPTNKILHQRKQIPTPLCSRCNLYPETHNHVLCCEYAQPIQLQQWDLVRSVLKTTLNTPTPIFNALEFGIRSWQEGESDSHWPFSLPSGSDPIDEAIYLAFHYQTAIGWPQALQGHLSSQWGIAMAAYMRQMHPHKPFQPKSWTRTVICSLQEYTYSQWMERNSHLHGVNHATSQALQRLTIQKQITEAFSNASSIPVNDQTFTFSLSLIERLLQPTANLNAWLLQYQARQHRLSNILKQERRNRGTITKFLIA
jgi:hypothetical protein